MVCLAASAPSDASHSTKVLKHKRRFCRAPGCTRIVKSQGLCQRHGAKPRKCKVEGCDKQAQGNFDGMCKSHFKTCKRMSAPLTVQQQQHHHYHQLQPHDVPLSSEPPPPEGPSVYHWVLPASISWHPGDRDDRGNPTEMPLIAHLREGYEAGKPAAWHRNEERRARGLWPVHNPAMQLEGWERELVWMEILVLTGNSEASFRHLARGWGRDKGFHMVLAQFICTRHGDVERKRRGRDTKESYIPRIEHDVTAASYHPPHNAAEVWDDACYNENEPLSTEMFNFSPDHHQHHSRHFSEVMFSGEEDSGELSDDFVVSSSEDGFLSDGEEKHAAFV
jgi:hypothetical protein